MSLTNLDHTSFKKITTKKGKTFLYVNIPGFCMVLFHSKECKACPGAMEEFAKAARSVPQVKFCVLDVHKNMSVIKQSALTDLKITKTPTFIIYREHKPFMIYTDKEKRPTAGPIVDALRAIISNPALRIESKPFSESRSEVRSDSSSSETKTSSAPSERKEIKDMRSTKSKEECEDGDCGLPFNIYCDPDTDSCYLTDAELDGGGCEDGECCYLTDSEL